MTQYHGMLVYKFVLVILFVQVNFPDVEKVEWLNKVCYNISKAVHPCASKTFCTEIC